MAELERLIDGIDKFCVSPVASLAWLYPGLNLCHLSHSAQGALCVFVPQWAVVCVVYQVVDWWLTDDNLLLNFLEYLAGYLLIKFVQVLGGAAAPKRD